MTIQLSISKTREEVIHNSRAFTSCRCISFMVKTRPECQARSAGQDYTNWPLAVLDSSKNLIALKADFHPGFPRSTSCRGRTFHHRRPGLVWHLAKINWPLCTWKKTGAWVTQWAQNLNNLSVFARKYVSHKIRWQLGLGVLRLLEYFCRVGKFL